MHTCKSCFGDWHSGVHVAFALRIPPASVPGQTLSPICHFALDPLLCSDLVPCFFTRRAFLVPTHVALLFLFLARCRTAPESALRPLRAPNLESEIITSIGCLGLQGWLRVKEMLHEAIASKAFIKSIFACVQGVERQVVSDAFSVWVLKTMSRAIGPASAVYRG